MIRVSVDDSKIKRLVEDFNGKATRCAAIALTKTAMHAQTDLKRELVNRIDRPTPFTMNATVIQRARYDRPGLLSAAVVWKDWQAKYMDSLVEGFSPNRGHKRFELALRAAGVLPAGWYAVPARGVKLDGYGNLSRGFLMKIVSQLGNELARGYQNRSTDQKKVKANIRRNGEFFAVPLNARGASGRRSRFPPGIYQRFDTGLGVDAGLGGHRVRGVLMFVRSARYRQPFNLKQIGQQAVEQHFADEFGKAFAS